MTDMTPYESPAVFRRRPVERAPRQATSVLLIGSRGPEIRHLADYLARQDVMVHEVEDDELDHAARTADRFDVVIVVASLPDPDVSEFIHRVSADDGAPILVMSDTGEFVERVLALELGADDLIDRDTNPREVLARLRVLVRRSRRHTPGRGARPEAAVPDDGCWTLDSVRRLLVAPSGECVDLSRADVELMTAFFDNDEQLIGDDYGPSAKLRTAISRLKGRALDKAEIDLPIRSVRGRGYRFDAPVVSA